jgi:hypothetical protein
VPPFAGVVRQLAADAEVLAGLVAGIAARHFR